MMQKLTLSEKSRRMFRRNVRNRDLPDLPRKAERRYQISSERDCEFESILQCRQSYLEVIEIVTPVSWF